MVTQTLRLTAALVAVLGLPALARGGDANFDTFPEGVIATTFTEDGITFSELDSLLPGSTPLFIAEQADGTLAGFAGFTSPNVLGFTGYSPGSGCAFGRVKTFKMSIAATTTSASLTVYEFASYSGNTITVQAELAGAVVASNTITIPSGFAIHANFFSFSGVTFDSLRVIGGGSQDGGVFFGTVDSVHFGPTAVGTVFCAGDGSGTACPCGNASPIGAGEGCLSSLNLGATLRGAGTASLSADTVVLNGAQMPAAPALYFQGASQTGGGAGAVFGDGLRCAGGAVARLGTKTNSAGGTSQYPAAGDPSVSVRGNVTTPGVRTYQVWYRNAASFCTPSTFNLSNGLQITWSS